MLSFEISPTRQFAAAAFFMLEVASLAPGGAWAGFAVQYLYASKAGIPRRLVATFGSEQQLAAYVRWATLQDLGDGKGKFEQGSALAGYNAWERSAEPLTDEDETAVYHNPSPTML